VVAVVRTIGRVIVETGFDLSRARVGVVGFGSIGRASLDLLLKRIGRPRSVVICDLASQLPRIRRSVDAMRRHYTGEVEIVAAGAEGLPAPLYEADLIIGASTSGPVLDPDRLSPGTIVVDDSFPSIVDADRAIRRMRTRRDVLIVGGGKLRTARSDRRLIGIPDPVIAVIDRRGDDEGMPGCRAESLLRFHDPCLPPVIGLVDPRTAARYWDAVEVMGLTAVPLHLESYRVEAEVLEGLRAELWRHRPAPSAMNPSEVPR
jgi:predicted amino acid dehydrogenase